MSALSGPGIQEYKGKEESGEGVLGGSGEEWEGWGASPSPHPDPGPTFLQPEADSPAAASCALSWNSYDVSGIWFWPVMKLQTAVSSLTDVTGEGEPLFCMPALVNLPGLSARALSPVAFLTWD